MTEFQKSYIIENASKPLFDGFLEQYSTSFKNWHSDATVSSADAFFYLWKARYSSASLKNLRATKKTKDVATAIFKRFNPEQATLTRVNDQDYFLRDRKPVSYDENSSKNSNVQQRAFTLTRPALEPCFIENVNVSVICHEFKRNAMIKESEEVVLELGEALALWNIFVIKPAVMDKNCALLSNNSIDIIAVKTVSADVNHSMLINNVVERALQSKDIARLYIIKELHANPSSALANVLFLLLSRYYVGIAWDKMDEDMFAQTALHPFLDVIFPVGHELIRHGQFSYLYGSKEHKPDVRYSFNDFDVLVLEVKTPRSNLGDTEKLAWQLKHMLQRITNAGLSDAAVFGIVIQGFNGYVYKMIQPSAELSLLIHIDCFQLPSSIQSFAVCLETIAALSSLQSKVMEQISLLQEIA
ncbi:hypothetical protein G6F42_016613 [Rhizopus arrhizus]|nr:hypothetical protein G6F42_016613 [Rhizopus arrhizus]